jgi:hypothetical protein
LEEKVMNSFMGFLCAWHHSVAHHGMDANAPDRPGLFYRLTRLLETRINISPMAPVETAKERGQQEGAQPLGLEIPARLEDTLLNTTEKSRWEQPAA